MWSRPLTVEQFRDLVEAVDNPYMQATIAVIGETGIRKRQALSLTWSRVDLSRGLLWVEYTKDDEPREIPLSKYATGYLAGLVRYLSTPYVFVNGRTGTRWVNPDRPLRRGRRESWIEGRFPRSEAIPLQPVVDAGGGRENGPEADGPLGHQHDHALCGGG